MVALYFVLAVLWNFPCLVGVTRLCAICTSYTENEEERGRNEGNAEARNTLGAVL
jgi:hypothetical protein